ncbi:MAG TPA: STAS domain-containing protein [Acidimicrobiales bacterium]|nr:STAS domain-containing protein [Acidimicrobiales bacterium]
MSEQIVELAVIEGRPSIRGECDLSNSPELAAWLDTFDGAPIELDLSGVTFLDSSALHVLITARQRNPRMRVGAASAIVLRLFEVTGTTDYLMAGTEDR